MERSRFISARSHGALVAHRVVDPDTVRDPVQPVRLRPALRPCARPWLGQHETVSCQES